MVMGLTAIVSCTDSTNGLQEKYDPIEAMRLPQNPAKKQNVILGGTPGTMAPEELREVIDISALSKIEEGSTQKIIQVTGNNVILRKGPGDKFESSGVANKDKTFKLLRTVPSPSGGPAWHWVEDENKNKFFQHFESVSISLSFKFQSPWLNLPDWNYICSKENFLNLIFTIITHESNTLTLFPGTPFRIKRYCDCRSFHGF